MEIINNKLQKEKIKNKKTMNGKDFYNWLKINKICVTCKKKISMPNKTRCGQCAYAEKIYQESLRICTKKILEI